MTEEVMPSATIVADMVKALEITRKYVEVLEKYLDPTVDDAAAIIHEHAGMIRTALARAKLLDLDRAKWVHMGYGDLSLETLKKAALDSSDVIVIPLRPTPGGESKPTVLRPSTIDELEAILNSETDEEIEILPDGSIRSKPTPGATNG